MRRRRYSPAAVLLDRAISVFRVASSTYVVVLFASDVAHVEAVVEKDDVGSDDQGQDLGDEADEGCLHPRTHPRIQMRGRRLGWTASIVLAAAVAAIAVRRSIVIVVCRLPKMGYFRLAFVRPAEHNHAIFFVFSNAEEGRVGKPANVR